MMHVDQWCFSIEYQGKGGYRDLDVSRTNVAISRKSPVDTENNWAVAIFCRIDMKNKGEVRKGEAGKAGKPARAHNIVLSLDIY